MTSYVIFGCGRVGTNLASYLEHLGHDVALVSRRKAENETSACAALIETADIVAAAIPDDKLEDWRDEWFGVVGARPAIHFSGAVSVDAMYGFHPLYSFSRSTMDVEKMRRIAFACPLNGPSFETVFPKAPNPHFKIADEDRARYHALAVLSGNLVSYIWNETANEFAAYSNMKPEEILGGYLESIVDRFIESPTDSLTGPVARRDKITASKNLASLQDNAKLQGLYQAFLNAAWPSFRQSGEN